MSDPKNISIEFELDEDYQEGMAILKEIIEINKFIAANAHLHTKEEIAEALKDFTQIVEMVFIAGQMTLESQMLVQDLEGDQK